MGKYKGISLTALWESWRSGAGKSMDFLQIGRSPSSRGVLKKLRHYFDVEFHGESISDSFQAIRGGTEASGAPEVDFFEKELTSFLKDFH